MSERAAAAVEVRSGAGEGKHFGIWEGVAGVRIVRVESGYIGSGGNGGLIRK